MAGTETIVLQRLDTPTQLAQHLQEASQVQSTTNLTEEVANETEAFDSYPNGGFQAWLQVFCCFCIFFTTLGGVYCWGVFQDALFAEGVASSSSLSYVGSTQASLEALFAIPINRLVSSFGPRKVSIVGSLLAGLGPISASFCYHNYAALLITEGIMFGIGQALCFFCVATLPGTYFSSRRNLATGIVYAGAGIGGASFSLLASTLITRFGIAWALRIVGLMFTAINLPCCLLLRSRTPTVPWTWTKKKTDDPSSKSMDLKLFKDIRFCLIFFAGMIALFPVFIPPFFLPLFGTSLGLPRSTSSFLLAGFNLASAFGRIGFGVAADSIGSLNSLNICLFSVALSTLVIWPVANSVGPLAAFAVINGFCAGGFFSLIPGVVNSLFKSTNSLSAAFSMIVTSWLPGYFLGAPIAGYLLQAFGGPDSEKGYEAYRPAIFYSGSLTLTSAMMVLVIRLIEGGRWNRKV